MHVTQIIQDIKLVIGSGTADKKGLVIFWDFGVNKDVGTYQALGPNYPETVVRKYITQMVENIFIGSSTANKRCGHFRYFTAERDFGTYDMLAWGQITLKQWSYPLLN